MFNFVNVDQIEERLFLGNLSAASNLNTLRELRITHVLTIASNPLSDNFVEQLPASISVKYVEIHDLPSADLLGRLTECVDFVSNAIDADGTHHNCLVHCLQGVSRSASVVIAYLMRKHRLDYAAAFKRVQDKRPAIGPNSGFVQQLRLFHQMDYRTDDDACDGNSTYKTYRLRLGLLEADDEFLHHPSVNCTLAPDPPAELEHRSQALLYRCRCCRSSLATDRDHIRHSRRTAMPKSLFDRYLGLLNDIFATGHVERRLDANGICNESILVRPIEWMRPMVSEAKIGSLLCPKCSAKIGRFDWTDRTRCACGALIGPAFHLVPSKIDICRPNKR